jgi:Mor family transcriptional regulator
MPYEGAKENPEVWERLFGRLAREFGELAPAIVQVLAAEIGGHRLTFPDLAALFRLERDRRLRQEFRGANLGELAIRYRVSLSQARRIVHRSK